MEIGFKGVQLPSAPNLAVAANSISSLSPEAIDLVFLKFANLATGLGASIVRSNEFAALCTFAYGAVFNSLENRDANMTLAAKSLIVKSVADSEVIPGIKSVRSAIYDDAAEPNDGPHSSNMATLNKIASLLAEGRDVSFTKFKRATRMLQESQTDYKIDRIIKFAAGIKAENMVERLGKLFELMHDLDVSGNEASLSNAADCMICKPGINGNFMAFMADSYIFAANPIKIALLATVHGNENLKNYTEIARAAKERFKPLKDIKTETLYAEIKRGLGIAQVNGIALENGRCRLDQNVWKLALWAFNRGQQVIESAAHANAMNADFNTLFGHETKQNVAHAISMYALLDTLSANGFKPVSRIEFINGLQERGWDINLRHLVSKLDKAGVIEYSSMHSRMLRLDFTKDVKYWRKQEISEADASMLALQRPYLQLVIKRVIDAINRIDSSNGFSVHDVCIASGVYTYGVSRTMNGLAELGIIEKSEPQYIITPLEPAKIAWEVFFKPLAEKARVAAANKNAMDGIADAAILHSGSADKDIDAGNLDSRIEQALNSYISCTKLRNDGANAGTKVPTRELVLNALSEHDGLSRSQIFESISQYDSSMNKDRLAWYLLQLRKDGKITLSERKYRRVKE